MILDSEKLLKGNQPQMNAEPIEALARAIAFRRWQPADMVPPPMTSADLAENLLGDFAAESDNLLLPPALEPAREALSRLSQVPRMSSLAIGALLFEAVRRLPPEQSYVNIGVWQGFSLLVGLLARPLGPCIGVDNFSEWGGPQAAFMQRFTTLQGPQHRFYAQDYVRYFRETPQPLIGVYFYDGPHRELDQYRGLELAHPHLAPGALIFVDDTNLPQVQAPTLAFVQQHPEYRPIFLAGCRHNRHPTWWNGLMILKKTG